MKFIRFKFSAAKALAAIQEMLRENGPLDLHTILKACYFADKEHLNRFGRPVFGATYRAMKFGPVPLEIYEMLKEEPLWLAEIGIDSFPWKVEGYRVSLQQIKGSNEALLSESDIDCLSAGIKKSLSMNFSERTLATHGPDWQAAQLGIMQYEDMIDESPEKAERVAYLREAGPLIRI